MIPILKDDFIYFDNSATTQKPQEVIDAICNYYKNFNANPNRGVCHLSDIATDLYEGARDRVAEFINAERNEIVFTKNATEALNLVANCWNLHEGDEILIYIGEHHSNILPWQIVADKVGAEIRYFYNISTPPMLNARTKVVAITAMSNVIGIPYDLTNFIKYCHDNNTIVVTDATQYIAHCPLDVKAIDADFVAFSGHKIYAPMGIGVLYGKNQWLQNMKPFIVGGGIVDRVTYHSAVYKDAPYRFESGTPNVEGAIGLHTALDTFKYDLSHDKELTDTLYDELLNMPYISLINDDRPLGLVSFNVSGVHSHDVAQYMADNNICIRAGKMCAEPLLGFLGINSICRASFGYYNTLDEVKRFVDVLSKVRKEFYV